MESIDLADVDVLTFDCYGTLIDWEIGILAALRRVIAPHVAVDNELLEAYAAREAASETARGCPTGASSA